MARHLLRAKDLVDARYFEALTVADMAAAAHMSPSHFSRQFSATFGEPPHRYLLTRRLERAAALLRTSDWSVTDICFAVGWNSEGSFTTDDNNQPVAPYFKVRVAIKEVHLRNVPADFRLIPGMTLTGDVLVGRRTILSYLVEGGLRTGSEAMREP